MANLRRMLLLAAVLLVAAPLAQAQTGTTSKLTITNSASSAVTIPQGTTLSVSVPVTLQLTNIVCSKQDTATVTLTPNDANPLSGITTALSSTTLSFLITAGQQAGVGLITDTSAMSATATLNVTVAKGVIPNHDHSFNITATFNPSSLPDCQGASASGATPPSPSTGIPGATASTGVFIRTGAGSGGGGNSTMSGSGSHTGSATSGASSSTKASPLADVPTVALMMVGCAFVAMRRRD